MMVQEFEFQSDKLLELMRYFAARADAEGDKTFGRTKLAKLLYYTDFNAYREWGEPVTGATYGHLTFGPCPNNLEFYENILVARGDAVHELTPIGDYEQMRLRCTRPFVSAFLRSHELRLADTTFEQLLGMSATQVSNLSHTEPGWVMTEIGETIPYCTAVLSGDPLTSRERAWMDKKVREIEGIA